jgi:hypothetical protein
MAAKPPNPIDVHVGGRVRMRRIEVDMSQQVLGGHIGLTFPAVRSRGRRRAVVAPGDSAFAKGQQARTQFRS